MKDKKDPYTQKDYEETIAWMESLRDKRTPLVGIYLYNPTTNTLYASIARPVSECLDADIITVPEDFGAFGDYPKELRRGKVVFDKSKNEYTAYVGNWIWTYPDAVDPIAETFLPSTCQYDWAESEEYDD